MAAEGDWHRQRRVTLADVAKRAHVSKALVSIVMRGAPGASPATREKVFAAARELGYRPDVRARSLASQRSANQRSRIIGVVFGMAGSFHFDLLEGLYTYADKHSYGLVLSALTRGRDEQQAVQSLNEFRFDALVMLGPAARVPLMAGTVPVVVIGWQVDHPAVDVVRTSDELGMGQGVAHLVALGHRKIAHIDGGRGLIATSRRRAYRRAMRRHGLESDIRIYHGGETQLDGQRAARTMLDEGDLPTAIVAFNDDEAVAAMGVLSQGGVDVPGRVSVIGWDDSDVARLSHVDLTSVAQQPLEMARLAIERIVARTERYSVEGRETVLEPHLVVRSSTGPPTRT